ncbi:MAG: hypothetical protein JWL67_2661, partial [Solirubrobacterales bacterium]|nr:hypothetical protein [Solirubrobacterales bacterium]
MPTFCRHNRFIERCPICSKTLPGQAPAASAPGRTKAPRRSSTGQQGRRGSGASLRVRREGRAEDDGFRSPLVPGLRSSADARRLAEEMAFASGRLLRLGEDPPDLYGEIRKLAAEDLERATWASFLIVYLSPLEDEEPFRGIRMALAALPAPPGAGSSDDGDTGALDAPDLADVPLGPHTSHDPARGAETLVAYGQWARRGGRPDAQAAAAAVTAGAAGRQAVAFRGDPAWTAPRRFERVFERLALPGFGRMGRYDLLVTLGYLGLYELQADGLHLGGARGV